MQKVDEKNTKRDFFDKSGVLTNNYKKLLNEIGYKKNMTKQEKEIFYNKYDQEFLTENPEFEFPCIQCKEPITGCRSWCYDCYIFASSKAKYVNMINDYDIMGEYDFWLKYF